MRIIKILVVTWKRGVCANEPYSTNNKISSISKKAKEGSKDEVSPCPFLYLLPSIISLV